MPDEDIHQAARWLSEIWREPMDDRQNASWHLVVGYRYDRIVAEMTRCRASKPAEHAKVGYGAPVFDGAGERGMASVTVFDDHRVYGYLPNDEWPSFVWPESEMRRLKAKRAKMEAGVLPPGGGGA